MKTIFIFLYLVATNWSFAQMPASASYFFAQVYNKEKTLYYAKEFLFRDVIKTGEKPVKFTMDALTAATSGELTALSYTANESGQAGLVFGFWGNYWNDAGVLYQGYGFYHLSEEDATELVNKLQQVVDDSKGYLFEDQNNNNVVFKYKDLEFLIYFNGSTRIRVFWKDFDSEWLFSEFKRTKKRFEKKMNE